MDKKFEIGQKVYLLPVRKGRKMRPVVYCGSVVKIGRKYIKVAIGEPAYRSVEFDMTGNFREKTEYSPDWTIYMSYDEAQEAYASECIWPEIWRTISGMRTNALSYGDLMKIAEIIGIAEYPEQLELV